MWFVVLALMPSNIFAVYLYGIRILLLLIISIVSALAAESVFQYLRKGTVTISDGSAVITGLLIVMNMPPDVPIWMSAFGSIFAIICVKQLFGGLGFNIFNPALAAKALISALWSADMTVIWIHKIPAIVNEKLPYKIFEAAVHSPLFGIKEIPVIISGCENTASKVYFLFLSDTMLKSLFITNISGYIGEVSVILLLLGGLFLLIKRIISWHIPAAFISTTALIMILYYSIIDFSHPVRAVLFNLLSGGFILGAFFMATDFVTSPVTKKGLLLFGAGCGLTTSLLRIWGISESVCFAILLMNAAVPLIDRFTRPRIFGTRLRHKDSLLRKSE